MSSSFSFLLRRLLSTAALLILASGCVSLPDSPSKTVTIFYSGSLNGNLAGCDCWGYPVAGLDKKAFYLKNLAGFEDSLLLDTGNLFEIGEDPLQADLIMQSYRELGYDLIGIGPQEFSNGFEALDHYARLFPFISHNLKMTGGSFPFSGYRTTPFIITSGPAAVEIVSLTDPHLFDEYPPAFRGHLEIDDPLAVLSVLWPEAESDTPRIVVLNGAHDLALRLAQTGVPDLVFYSPTDEPAFEMLPNGGVIAAAGLDGNSLGRITLEIDEGDVSAENPVLIDFDYLTSPGDLVIGKRADEYIKALRKRISG